MHSAQFFSLAFISYLLSLGSSAFAQVGVGPQQLPLPPAIQEPRDVPYQGLIQIAVDAADTAHKVYSVHEVVPVNQAGPMVLLYPQWDSGSHAATGSVANLAGLFVREGGHILEWRRDPVTPFAFHIDVPAGVNALEIDFQYLSPVGSRGAPSMSADMLRVSWQNLMLYPAGYYVRDLPVRATLKLPSGFHQSSSLRLAATTRDQIEYQVTTIERLVDAPVYAGRYFKAMDLTPAGRPTVTLDLFGDSPEDLDISEAQVASLRAMVLETLQIFESTHYEHYDFLVSVSDLLPGGGGLEHLDSSEIGLAADFFRNAKAHLSDITLFPHEYVHSWNGLYRQPAGLWTANFNVPMRDSLLWVYEGQTEFWGLWFAARSGLLTAQEVLDLLALDAATSEARRGRVWKSLQDSNNDPLFDAGHAVPWRDWQRREDYYPEGVLLWLDVDHLIRKQTLGRRSLADFASAFFRGKDHSLVTQTYTLDDVCRTLFAITPYDWAGFFQERLNTHSSIHLLDGLAGDGYRLTYTTTPTGAYLQQELDAGATDLSYSIGLSLDERGVVRTVAWDGPSFRAGMAMGARILSVNRAPFTTAKLQEAVANSEFSPVEITYVADGSQHSVRLDYKGGLRYPRLERIPGTADLLAPVLSTNERSGGSGMPAAGVR